ncbi:hypothetical protein [Flavobacterium panici]|uniref:Lipoprotein n=1 Tax=Flavobacterium panici TaxID=2654843 RepID=A0A9N8P0Q9_9FLAO|nr:hypothetical protein [Flavobacterium panici]CAC9973247.1 hypothetical protein FLAPXU55_00927 [Flavobacterium panici]
MRKFYFLAFLLLGFFIMPSNTFACVSKSKTGHSTTQMSSTNSKKDCCAAGHMGKKNHCCDNNCKDSKCICAPSAGVFLVFNETSLKTRNYFFGTKNQKFNHPESSISSGYSSLFLKPKIG